MTAVELRIGNLVSNMNPRHNDSILTIESIGDNHEVNMFYRKYLLSELEPIQLTEEWLLKFGFDLDIEDDGYKKGKYKVSVDDEGCLFFINIGYYTKEIAEFNYVHQLQNLYFALTGEELTFKSE